MRILIAGGPRSGKSTLGRKLAAEHHVEYRCTDELIPMGWSEASEAVTKWFERSDGWLIEGVAVPRAIRKWFRSHKDKPADVCYWLGAPRVELSPGQNAMAKGCRKVWDEVVRDLERSGCEVRYG